MNPYNVLPLFRQGVFHGKNANIHLFCVGRRYISMTKDMTQGSPLKLLLFLSYYWEAAIPKKSQQVLGLMEL